MVNDYDHLMIGLGLSEMIFGACAGHDGREMSLSGPRRNGDGVRAATIAKRMDKLP